MNRNSWYSPRWLSLSVVGSLSAAGIFLAALAGPPPPAEGREDVTAPAPAAAGGETISGEELFLREWLPGDARSQSGDGLGPVFNETSCAACHNQGGIGGGGPAGHNVQIISAFSNPAASGESAGQTVKGAIRSIFRRRKPPVVATPEGQGSSEAGEIRRERERLAKIHPGFRSQLSVVLHRSSTFDDYARFRGKFSNTERFGNERVVFGPGGMTFLDSGDEDLTFRAEVRLTSSQERELNRLLGQAQLDSFGFLPPAEIDGFTFIRSERNPTALFGSGLIDSIPQEAILAAAARKHPGLPEIRGRAARLKDGRIGRFGWKAQEARLEDFVLTACAVELGLEVPGRPQSGAPERPDYRAPGLDLTARECGDLVAYVASLPAPIERRSPSFQHEQAVEEGRRTFASIGCAACHAPELGGVEGIYSDLLLHDMGAGLSDSGSYGAFVPNVVEGEGTDEPVPSLAADFQGARRGNAGADEKIIGARRQEWRTPPLWGARDSAPYLHDGRAATLEQAIAFHGGEAVRPARRFFALSADDRLAVMTFLKTLAAPR